MFPSFALTLSGIKILRLCVHLLAVTGGLQRPHKSESGHPARLRDGSGRDFLTVEMVNKCRTRKSATNRAKKTPRGVLCVDTRKETSHG